MTLTIVTFILFTTLVAVATWWFTRGGDKDVTDEGYFLAGRSLTGVFIAGSLLLTNLSTEQLIGLNGRAFVEGLSVMAWEVIAGMSLVALALYFLPRYLRSGIATIPQFFEERYGAGVRAVTTNGFCRRLHVDPPAIRALRGRQRAFRYARAGGPVGAQRVANDLGRGGIHRAGRFGLRDLGRLESGRGLGHLQRSRLAHWRSATDVFCSRRGSR